MAGGDSGKQSTDITQVDVVKAWFGGLTLGVTTGVFLGINAGMQVGARPYLGRAAPDTRATRDPRQAVDVTGALTADRPSLPPSPRNPARARPPPAPAPRSSS